ncbi:MAG: tRNA-dihydrouridine synthase [Pseudomonadota bacterium]
MLTGSSTLYDIHKTFEENFRNPPFSLINPPVRQWPPKAQWIRFLGLSLASNIGAAACAVTTGKGIALLAQLGFDVLTYKTIRRHFYPSHPLPNIVYVDCELPLAESDIAKPIYTRKQAASADKMAISNSFGNACLAPEILIQDIAFAKSALSEGQLLIVSVYGEGETLAAIATEFAETALFAKQAGADIIELNLSCPNLLKKGEPIYWDAEAVYKITTRVLHSVGEVPVVIKLGFLPSIDSLSKILEVIARAGASGVSAINSISMRVIDRAQQPAFGKRIFSGVSGYPIRLLALQYIKKIAQINQKQKLDLAILGMGGITLPEHFNEFSNAGSDIVLSATGMMWNPYLAFQYHQKIQ